MKNSPINSVSLTGLSAVHGAAANEHVEVVALLVRNGANRLLLPQAQSTVILSALERYKNDPMKRAVLQRLDKQQRGKQQLVDIVKLLEEELSLNEATTLWNLDSSPMNREENAQPAKVDGRGQLTKKRVMLELERIRSKPNPSFVVEVGEDWVSAS